MCLSYAPDSFISESTKGSITHTSSRPRMHSSARSLLSRSMAMGSHMPLRRKRFSARWAHLARHARWILRTLSMSHISRLGAVRSSRPSA